MEEKSECQMILVNQGAATMLQTRETAAWQHEITFCIVYLPFVELYSPQEIAVASKLTRLSRQGTGQQRQRKLVSASSQVKDPAPVAVMEPGSRGGPWSGLLAEAPGVRVSCKWVVLASTGVIIDCHRRWTCTPSSRHWAHLHRQRWHLLKKRKEDLPR